MSVEKKSFEFPRYYFVREVVGEVAAGCLVDVVLSLIQSPYDYGIEFAELPRMQQVAMEADMRAIPARRLIALFRLVRSHLESEVDAWESTLRGSATEYIRTLVEAESFLRSLGKSRVIWSVRYDE